MINLFSKTDDFIKNISLLIKYGKVYFLEKHFRWFAVSTCPPGQVLAGPDMSEVRVLVQVRTFRLQNCFFDEVSQWFCMVLPGEAQKHVFLIKSVKIWPKIPKILGFLRVGAHMGPYGPIRAHMGPILFKKLLSLIKNHKTINKNIKIVNLEILKVKTWFGDKDLFS